MMRNDWQVGFNVWKHFIVDLNNVVFDKLTNLNESDIIMKLENILKKNWFNVLWNKFHFFWWIESFTGIYLLSESHFSIHTWPELWYVSIDLFCCNFSNDYEKNMDISIDKVIEFLFNKDVSISKKIINR